MAAGVCVLCNLDVSEDEHRREIDCPSKSCPGRVYHEDCISAYLKRTKYSKDRCTGFPCPAILSSGKPCPGYVCKMHAYFPTNQKKKQARLEAAKAAAALPKPRPAPVQHKAAAQVAIAAMKRAVPEGGPHPAHSKLQNPPIAKGPVGYGGDGGVHPKSLVQQPRMIPGLSGPVQDLSSREALRAQVAKLRAEAKGASKGALAGGRGGGNDGALGRSTTGIRGVRQRSGGVSDDEAQERPLQAATVWDSFANSPDLDADINLYDPKEIDRESGGAFSAMFRRRVQGISPARAGSIGFDYASSECDSTMTSSTARDADESGLQFGLSGANSVLPSLSGDEMPASPPTPPANGPLTPASTDIMSNATCSPGAASVQGVCCPDIAAYVTPHNDDPVVEYEHVYGASDGSYLVFDPVSSEYYRPCDMYGEAVKVVEVCAEDGNTYVCVEVCKSQLELRTALQHSWLQAQVDKEPDEQQVLAYTAVGAADTQFVSGEPYPAYGQPDTSAGAVFGVATTNAAEPIPEDDDEADVASLMQLLCV